MNETNVKPLTKELVDYLEVSDQDFRGDLTAKICSIVSKWVIEVLNDIPFLVHTGYFYHLYSFSCFLGVGGGSKVEVDCFILELEFKCNYFYFSLCNNFLGHSLLSIDIRWFDFVEQVSLLSMVNYFRNFMNWFLFLFWVNNCKHLVCTDLAIFALWILLCFLQPVSFLW